MIGAAKAAVLITTGLRPSYNDRGPEAPSRASPDSPYGPSGHELRSFGPSGRSDEALRAPSLPRSVCQWALLPSAGPTDSHRAGAGSSGQGPSAKQGALVLRRVPCPSGMFGALALRGN